MTLGVEREDYDGGSLDPADVDADPMVQFRAWVADAVQSGIGQPEAMTLATVGPDGRPTSRYVLLRGADERGMQFFTNYDSDKGRHLAERPYAALTFGWLPIHRSVRIEGPVERLSEAESDNYFGGRPREARLGAWASPQSRVIGGRDELERALAQAQERFAGGDVPRPPHWGGFLLRPDRLELWQGRSGRLHDRVRYERDGGAWKIERLAP
ncbi:MAG: pyridoxamine 5-phosphate oxidase [Solirubrobacteraceae bacterium]|nr:pyridoxamine 5-phosphate oxidase [Solirubrobacteraceae bacterium]